jgi:hypothetical protein
MGAAKPVSLSVRPYQVSHLCFEVGGVLEVSVAQLGTKVSAGTGLATSPNAFDFPAFYTILGGVPTVAGDASRLLYDFLEIEAAVAPFALAALRKEGRKAALNSAINARQNAFFAKYANKTAIIAQMNQSYSPSVIGSKLQRLEVLAGISTDQFNLQKAAYGSAPLKGVNTTTSTLCSDTSSYGYAATSGITEEAITTIPDLDLTGQLPVPPNPPTPWTPPPWPTPCTQAGQSEGSGNSPVGSGGASALPSPPPPPPATNNWGEGLGKKTDSNVTETYQNSASYQTTSSADKARQSQIITNFDYSYRVPYLEAAAQFERAQISLIDQQFAQFMYGQNLPNLLTVFNNELNSIDGNVFRLQVAYLNSILMSPITGIVTGVYKNPGDAVKAGEPVVRVEDNSTIYLVATVIYRGPIVIAPPGVPPPPNSTVTIGTSLFGASPLSPPLSGGVVSARGHRDDDKWDLVVKCANPLDASGNPTFPLGYHFDFDDTTVSIT